MSGSKPSATTNRSSRSRSARSRSPGERDASTRLTWDDILITRLLPWRVEIAGLALFLLATLTFLGLLGLADGSWVAGWSRLLRQLAGWGAFPLCLSLAVTGLHVALRRLERPYRVWPGQVIGFELVLLAALPLSHLLWGGNLASALAGGGGGVIGWALAEPLVDFLGSFLAGLLHLGLLLWGTALLLRVTWYDAILGLRRLSFKLRRWAREIEPPAAARPASKGVAATRTAPGEAQSSRRAPRHERADELIIISDSATESEQADGDATGPRRSRRLPPLRALESGVTLVLTREEIDQKKQLIEQCLLDFGLPATVTEIRRGPAVTQFGVQPGYIEKPGADGEIKAHKVRVGQIAALQKDLALVLAAPRLRVEAPVPGRGIVGIEVPNSQTAVVRLRSLVESEAFHRLKSPLAVGLGYDVAGGSVVTDLAKLPHLLIAGTTGSGKSVCMNALITCLVLNNTPEQLRLVMIDPKRVELIRFNGLPHLLGRVEVEGDRVLGVMRWLTAEMDRRYQLFATVGAKHLADFNRKIGRLKEPPPELSREKLPHIVVFIDELADLMATYGVEVERTLCRLAQMARATGMHLVVATQRPSTDVITGLIKANFPARASFAVASGFDSRVILDTVGAEQLLGRGDMLFLSPDASAPTRVQGCFVGDHEIEAIVSHWQKVTPEAVGSRAPWEDLIARQSLIDETDDMLEQAVALAQKLDTLSTSLLQRRLRVGYPRAARLMEALYEMGMVEDPKEGGRTRRTHVDEEDDPLGDYLARD
jgi:DNA segregation ATPase FtsK/SpoIIIE, S-DNA-T family